MLNSTRKFYRWGPIDACPLFMYFCIEPAFAPLKELFGVTYSESLIYFEEGKVTWLLDEEQLEQESTKFVESVILNEKKYAAYLDEWKNRTRKLKQIFDMLDSTDLSSIGKAKLLELFKEFTERYNNWFTITISHELVTASLEQKISKQLKAYFASDQTEQFQEAFSIVTAPDALTFYRREQLDLMRIVQLPQDQQEQSLIAHQHQYYWIYNSYAHAKELDIAFFANELENLTKNDYQKEQLEIKGYEESIKAQKKQLIKELQLSNQDSNLVSLITTFANLLDERKMVNFKADHYLEKIAHEFSKRTQHSVEDIKFLLPNEIMQVFDIFDSVQVIQRKQGFALSCSESKIEQFSGIEAQQMIQKFNTPANVVNKIISGTVASMGATRHFRGTARVIHSIREIDKVKQGEILITPMTSPDFVIGMKRAGAVITDTGGMLCHAAIVSREFGIPCIVGTEYATQMIHDGDVVEMHCVNGSIRIVNN